MALESGTYIDALNVDNPVNGDSPREGDDHLKLIKKTIKNTFPNLTGAVTATQDELNHVDGVTSSIQAQLNALPAAIQALYPVGSIYINASVATNPGTLLGFGTWTAFGAGRVPVGIDAGNPAFNTAEETGGSADAIVVSHTHTATDSGHTHTTPTSASTAIGYGGGFPSPIAASYTGVTGSGTANITVSTEGVSGTNANLQPYVVVYMWKRTA